MMIAKTSSRTKEQKERKEKDPRRAQLEAKLVNPVSLTLFFLILAVSIVIGVVLGTTTEVQDWGVAAVIAGGSLVGLYFMLALKIADQWEKAIVVDFGAFVDIGVKHDGLVHISQMADRYVKNPLEVVSVGDVVEVRVISLDLERGRIGLSMKK